MKVAALLIVALLAGCLGGSREHGPGASDAEAPIATGDPGAPQAMEPPRVRVSAGPEVELGRAPGNELAAATIDPEGTSYILSGGAVWRSVGGGPWEPAHGFACQDGLPECPDSMRVAAFAPALLKDLIAAPDGPLHAVGGESGSLYHLTSTDQGDTWQQGALLHDRPGVPSISSTANGTLHVSWREVDGFGVAWRNLSRDAWQFAPYGGGGIQIAGPVVADPVTGTILVPVQAESRFRIQAAIHDEGKWQARSINEGGAQTHRAPRAAVDSEGTFYIVWAYDTNRELEGAGWQAGAWIDTSDVYLSTSTDGGQTFTEPVQVNPPGTSAILPEIAAAGPGNFLVSWLQTPVGDGHPIDAEWRVMAAVSTDANQSLEPLQLTSAPVNVAATCTAGSLCSPWALGAGLGVAVDIGPDGQAIVAWNKEEPGQAYPTTLVSRIEVEPHLWA